MDRRIEHWLNAAEARHLADLEFREVSRALRALSATYVERRDKIGSGAALAGAGKRAAFALFYAPIHLLLVEHIVRAHGAPFTQVTRLLDLGCGSGASGAGWALACDRPIDVTGVDRHPWAVEEARQTFRELGLRGTFRVDDLTRVLTERAGRNHGPGRSHGPGGRLGQSSAVPPRTSQKPSRLGALKGQAILTAFAINELSDAAQRTQVLSHLLDHANAGGHCLVVEPLAGRVAPWWKEWQRAFESSGGRANEWRVRTALPSIVEKLDRAAGLDHRELTARSLAI